jgi:hypothetical protein
VARALHNLFVSESTDAKKGIAMNQSPKAKRNIKLQTNVRAGEMGAVRDAATKLPEGDRWASALNQAQYGSTVANDLY